MHSLLSTEAILERLHIQELNEMQQAAVAAIHQRKDVILLSPTGSGKTLAFLLPLVRKLNPKGKHTQMLIIVPSRELALQTEAVFKSMGTNYKITCCYGGHARETEENSLIQSPAVIVGTPGRLADHMRRKNISVPSIETLVLDEFDKSLELGFEEDMAFILESLPNMKQRILTSATDAVELPAFVGMSDAIRLDYLPAHKSVAGLTLNVVRSDQKDKLETLFKLLCHIGNKQTIIFCNHRAAVERTSEYLAKKGIENAAYHGGLEQQEREAALSKFRNGSVTFLVTTDLAARGLDIPDVKNIIHYHLPATGESFVHRNGRTARMHASGTAILLLAPEEELPTYISNDVETIMLPDKLRLPAETKWITLFIAAGKKDKVNKIDIVGFLSHKGGLKKEDIGLVEVKDFSSFVAINRAKALRVLQQVKSEKIKNKRVRIAIAK